MQFSTTESHRSHRPIVAVRVIAPNGNQILVDALIDSGSDRTLFTPAAAELLQLDLSQIPETRIASALGTVDSYQSLPLTLQLRRDLTVLTWQANVGFVKRRLAYCILGTRGFFEHFRFDYDAAQCSFTLHPNSAITAIESGKQ